MAKAEINPPTADTIVFKLRPKYYTRRRDKITKELKVIQRDEKKVEHS